MTKNQMANILKGRKYILVEWPECQTIVDYLEEYRPDIYEHCHATDDAAWFIPVDALDHMVEE